MSQSPPIIYTRTDEAPALATYSLLPIIRAFAGATGVPVETRDISLAGRILAVFPERLTPEQREPDGLAELGALVKTPEANVIKLPNISASIPQMKAAIAELQAKGYALPDYPEEPRTGEERETKARYDQLVGAMKEAAGKMDPVLAAFKDQTLFLKHNLNARAIASLETDLNEIRSEVTDLIKEMEASIAEANLFIDSLQG